MWALSIVFRKQTGNWCGKCAGNNKEINRMHAHCIPETFGKKNKLRNEKSTRLHGSHVKVKFFSMLFACNIFRYTRDTLVTANLLNKLLDALHHWRFYGIPDGRRRLCSVNAAFVSRFQWKCILTEPFWLQIQIYPFKPFARVQMSRLSSARANCYFVLLSGSNQFRSNTTTQKKTSTRTKIFVHVRKNLRGLY